MRGHKYFWNKKNYLFKSKIFGWILYSGQSGKFLPVSEAFVNSYKKSIDDISENEKERLLKIEALTLKAPDEYESIHNYRYLKFQNNHIFTLVFCPVKKVEENEITIDRKIIPSLIDFCVKKNQHIIKCLWLGEKPLSAFAFIREFSKKLKKIGISAYHGISVNGLELNEKCFSELINNSFTDFRVLVSDEIFLDKNKYSKFLDNIEVVFNYLNTNHLKIQFSINVIISDTNKDMFIKIRDYFMKRYGEYFVLSYCLEKNREKCPDKFYGQYVSNDDFNEYVKFDEYFGIKGKKYFPNFSKGAFCSAQYNSSFVIDWQGNVLKCWNDLGKPEKSIFDLKTKKSVNLQVEYNYLMNHSRFKTECKTCDFVSLCNGGCVNENVMIGKNCNSILLTHFEKIFDISQNKEKYLEI